MAFPSPRVAVTVECGFRNATPGIVVGTALPGDVRSAIPSAVHGPIMLFTGFGYALFVARRQGGAGGGRGPAGS